MSQIGSTERRGDGQRRTPGDRSERGGGAVQHAAPALAALGVSKRFGVVRALDDVTVAVRAGEVLALVGENGAASRRSFVSSKASIDPTRELWRRAAFN